MNPIVEFKNVSKTFYTKNGPFQALNQINLAIQEGDIFGIIGLSGAGKSTLVRCINYLEVPTEGEVRIAGRDLGKMNQKELRRQRQEIGMIFQNFNLLMQRNVLDNICFPLEIAGVKKADARKRAEELLEIVGLSDKAKSYPSQLSGGQKQRVAIARALATNPKILLCDEATSALDPTTTKAILALLKEINQKFKITIVIITHEMAVVEEICNQVAIVDAGKLVETGSATDVFSKPQTEIAKQLVYKEEANQLEVGGKRYVRVVFDGNSSFEPAIADMILNCRVRVNIMGADMKNIDGKAYGQMILQMPDEDVKAQQAIHYLEERNIIVERSPHMETQELIKMLAEGSVDTLYMTLVSTALAYVIGFPMGIALIVTRKDGLKPMPAVNRILDIFVNILRSIPFLILLIAVTPLTKLIVGKSYGSTATIVPLVIAAAPFIARMIESSLLEVEHGVVEAALSMGASPLKIIVKVLIPEAKTSLIVGCTIALSTILGYSAMAGVVAGGGLGDIAIRYGYHRYQTDIMLITVIVLVLIVQILQEVGMQISKRTDKRVRG